MALWKNTTGGTIVEHKMRAQINLGRRPRQRGGKLTGLEVTWKCSSIAYLSTQVLYLVSNRAAHLVYIVKLRPPEVNASQ